ncbi:hypothetical protein HYG86_07490 [Alkalicella caledoniensis]|uniref:DUF3784 domain-containing protein n=1 Tax=Alkalicella caledoniensis TaxID=2731377 RepID=A0A7G9W7H6_ALKCA|nr:hypothetical protein [Alkalicella caledoniensis]QNO14638.1 hypothetical protein HYG86_07490 [Alkalicella caledoniensis]
MVNLVYLTFSILVAGAGLFIYNKIYFEFDLGEEYEDVDGEGVAMWIGSNVMYMGIVMSVLTLIRILLKDFMSMFLVFGILMIAYGFTMRIRFGLHKFKASHKEGEAMPNYMEG